MRKILCILLAVVFVVTFVASVQSVSKPNPVAVGGTGVLLVTEKPVKSSVPSEVLTSLNQLPKNAADIVGLLIDSEILGKAAPEAVQNLKTQFGNGKAIVAYGDSVDAKKVARYIGIELTQETKLGHGTKRVAAGVMQLADGRTHTIEVVTDKKHNMSAEEIQASIANMIAQSESDLRNVDLEQGMSIQSAGWIIFDSTIRSYTASSNFGTYTTTAAAYYLNASYDADPSKDYLQIRTQHTSQAGAYNFAKANTANEPGNGQTVVEYGPMGNFTSGGAVSFSLGYPPAVGFSFSLGSSSTQLTNQSQPSYPRIRHEVKYGAGSPEAKGSLAWLQPINTSTPQGQKTVFYWFTNNLTISRSAFFDNWYWVVTRP